MSFPATRHSFTVFDWETALREHVPAIIARALAEDIGPGDVTTQATIPADLEYTGHLIAKADGIVAGLDVTSLVFRTLDPAVEFRSFVEDGAPVERGMRLARVSGSARSLLTAERVALNLLQRMSGIASLTRRYVRAVAGTQAVILDTRKTAPGLRVLDKRAVVLGGGSNHRIGLYDMALIKNNHITAAGGITAAVARVRAAWGDRLPIEVEVASLAELDEALPLGVDLIMLDNMDTATLREAVHRTAGRVPLEASGNVSLETVAQIAATGVNYISVGKLTHSVEGLDISFTL